MSSQPLSLATATEERRRGPRTDVDEPAYISYHGSSTRCQVVNISAEGAAIDVPDAVFVPARFQLMTEKDRVVRDCRLVWTKQNRIGVIFEQAYFLSRLAGAAGV